MFRSILFGLVLAAVGCLAGISWAGSLESTSPVNRQPFHIWLDGPGSVTVHHSYVYTVTVVNWTGQTVHNVNIVMPRASLFDSWIDVYNVVDSSVKPFKPVKLTRDSDGDTVWRVNLPPRKPVRLNFSLRLPGGAHEAITFIYSVEARFGSDYNGPAMGALVRSRLLH